MFNILKDNTELATQIKAMPDNDFYNAIVAHSLADVYANLGQHVDKFNEQSEGVYTFNLFIPERINSFVAEITGRDISAETQALLVNDSYVPPMATHQLIELVLENWHTAKGETQLAVSALKDTYLFNMGSEHIITDAYKHNYRWSNERLESVKEHEAPSESIGKIMQIEEQLARRIDEQFRFKTISADYLQATGLLREFIESGSASPNNKLVEIMGNKSNSYTEINFSGVEHRSSYSLFFNNEHALIIQNTDSGRNHDHKIVKLDGRGTFTIDSVSYEASLEGIKTLEMDRFDDRSFKLTGNADYLKQIESPDEAQSIKVKTKFKP